MVMAGDDEGMCALQSATSAGFWRISLPHFMEVVYTLAPCSFSLPLITGHFVACFLASKLSCYPNTPSSKPREYEENTSECLYRPAQESRSQDLMFKFADRDRRDPRNTREVIGLSKCYEGTKPAPRS